MATENQISDLINHSGRLRMLSHRAGMFITYISSRKPKAQRFIDELPVTLEKFDSSYKKVTTSIRNETYLAEAFIEFNSNKMDIDNTVNQFLAQATKLSRIVVKSDHIDEEAIYQLLELISGELLVTLNTLVEFFEFALAKITTQKIGDIRSLANEITGSLEEVDQINLSTKILSFNANVEAARAGDLGKGFAVVSKEMNSLSSQTKLVSERVKNSVVAFVDALGS